MRVVVRWLLRYTILLFVEEWDKARIDRTLRVSLANVAAGGGADDDALPGRAGCHRAVA